MLRCVWLKTFAWPAQNPRRIRIVTVSMLRTMTSRQQVLTTELLRSRDERISEATRLADGKKQIKSTVSANMEYWLGGTPGRCITRRAVAPAENGEVGKYNSCIVGVGRKVCTRTESSPTVRSIEGMSALLELCRG